MGEVSQRPRVDAAELDLCEVVVFAAPPALIVYSRRLVRPRPIDQGVALAQRWPSGAGIA